jgi:hypothetical protein
MWCWRHHRVQQTLARASRSFVVSGQDRFAKHDTGVVTNFQKFTKKADQN